MAYWKHTRERWGVVYTPKMTMTEAEEVAKELSARLSESDRLLPVVTCIYQIY